MDLPKIELGLFDTTHLAAMKSNLEAKIKHILASWDSVSQDTPVSNSMYCMYGIHMHVSIAPNFFTCIEVARIDLLTMFCTQLLISY